MDKYIFEKIINDLKKINYNGTVGLYSNNEPLLDSDIISKAEYIKKMIPNCKLYIYTNGILLTQSIMEKLIPCLDCLTIDCYDDKLKIPGNIRDIILWAKAHNVESKIIVYKRKQTEKLSNRAGQAPNRNRLNRSLKSTCAAPFE